MLGDAGPLAEKTVAAVLGEIVWLMSQSAEHRDLPISALERLVMPGILLRQFKLFYHEGQPVAAVVFARVTQGVGLHPGDGGGFPDIGVADWSSGPEPRVVLAVSPHGPADAFIADVMRIHRHALRE